MKDMKKMAKLVLLAICAVFTVWHLVSIIGLIKMYSPMGINTGLKAAFDPFFSPYGINFSGLTHLAGVASLVFLFLGAALKWKIVRIVCCLISLGIYGYAFWLTYVIVPQASGGGLVPMVLSVTWAQAAFSMLMLLYIIFFDRKQKAKTE